MEFSSPVELPPIPDNLSIPQFILSADFSCRPVRRNNVPFFIEDTTGRNIGFEEAHRRTYGLANGLSLKYNLGNNDVVCILSPNHVDYPVAIWAVHVLGGIITPSNPGYTIDELVHQLNATKSVLIFTHSMFLDSAYSAAKRAGISNDRVVLLDAITKSSTFTSLSEIVSLGANKPENYTAQRYQPGEGKTRLAFLSFSSGTTGKPKAVAISHYGVISNVLQMAAHYRLLDSTLPEKRMNPGDIAIAILPFFHIYGLVVNMHYALFSGMSLVVIPKFNFTEFLKSIVRHRINFLLLVPPQIVLLCKHPSVKNYDLNHITFCMSGAAPLSGELMHTLTEILPNAVIGQGYGLTETCTSVSMLPPTCRLGQIGSAGQLLPGVEARVVRPDGTLAGEGEQGELVVKGPSMALGYYNDVKATKETFVDGWVHTGDEVIIKKLEVFVVDRLKELMKVRGFQVAPAELEGHLLLHPDVVDACVVGIADEYSGEVPLAYVVPSPNALRRISGNKAEAEALKAQISKHVADLTVSYKWLSGGVEFIQAIPKNPSGKILRRVLREKAKHSAALKPPRTIVLSAKL